MCEVTAENFNKILPELEKTLQNAKFISIDTEFSCLNASQNLQNSLFDSNQERYLKLKATIEQMIPLQIGLTAYIFDRDNNSYLAHIYTFYVYPKPFGVVDRTFLCQASSFQFLSSHGFDFNKLIAEGISYLNRNQEEKLRHNCAVVEGCMPNEVENVCNESCDTITDWMYKSDQGDDLILKSIEVHKHNLELKFFLHKHIRSRFKNIWTFENEEGFIIHKVTKLEYENLSKNCNLTETVLSELLGFSKIIRLVIGLQKPVIGHNFLLDLMVLIHNFEKPLPKSYGEFKKMTHELFPHVFDTKCLSFDITTFIPDGKRWAQNSLQGLYEYFKDGYGRHMAINSPLIEPIVKGQQTYHYAGWDSYCTGYIFIRMAHVYAFQCYGIARQKKFMSGELLQAVQPFKDTVNVIRGSSSHINLKGNDPISKRPPWLIVETIKSKPININEIAFLLGRCGFVEVKPHSFKGHRLALVAVDNFGSAKRILKLFKSHSDYRIQQYSVLKHSPIAVAILWGGIIASSAFLAWYGYGKVK